MSKKGNVKKETRELKNIIELAKEKVAIRSYKEDFIKYPVKNECHKGKYFY